MYSLWIFLVCYFNICSAIRVNLDPDAECDGSFYWIKKPNKLLFGGFTVTQTASNSSLCKRACFLQQDCRSINFLIGQDRDNCELQSFDHTNENARLRENTGSVYYGMQPLCDNSTLIVDTPVYSKEKSKSGFLKLVDDSPVGVALVGMGIALFLLAIFIIAVICVAYPRRERWYNKEIPY